MHIGDYLGRRSLYTPDRLAIVDAGKSPELRLSYRQLNERADRLAHWLRAAGLQSGARVAILARDGVEHLDCFFACAKLGLIHTALNWRLHWREVEAIFQSVAPRVLLFSDDFKESVRALRTAVTGQPYAPTHWLHLEGEGLTGSRLLAEVLAESRPDPAGNDAVETETTAALIFTGGTTGRAKAAQITHRMIGWNTLNTVIHDVTHGDVYLNVFPMFHTGGLFVYTLPQVIFGGTTILLRQFEPARVLELIERERVTIFAGVPTMYQALTTAPNWARADLSSLRFCTSGGAPLPVPLVEQYVAEKGVRFKQGFGMTEFGPGVFALAPEDAVRKAGSIGRPNFFVDARVLDDQNQPLGADQVGELVLKGPSFCSGYFNDPEASAAAVDAQGWFHTGDLARYDAEGYFYIVDRKKDMFISGGENVYPVEIETVLYEHPAVHMCAVVGVPDPKWGEVGHASVVVRPGASATPAELLDFLAARLARHKVPKTVTLREALPLSAAGKILKRELREQLATLLEAGSER
ncbi:MAG: long-chain fatty acid--CoA ligase [Burkholderiales bacterium]